MASVEGSSQPGPDALGVDSGPASGLDSASRQALAEAYRRTSARRPERTGGRSWAWAANRFAYWLSRHWFAVFLTASSLFVIGPWLAPIFMRSGWTSAGESVYTVYSYFCHQLPQRSFFLFGPSPSLSFESIRSLWADTANPFLLRQFVGNASVGYKVAWSDRMVSMYTSIPLAALLWWPFRKRFRPFPFWAFALLALPMAADGLSHAVSDLAGIGQGFRDSNQWLIQLTAGAWGPDFYAGDTLGSFNSWMRLITGTLFGIGLVGFTFPQLEWSFSDMVVQFRAKLSPALSQP
jgi:uncharacterized membrane protein